MRGRTPIRSFLVRLVAVTLVAAAAYAAFFYYMGRSAPSWYDPPDPGNERLAAVAERIEFRFQEETQRIRPADETWKMLIHDHQVNAWLGTRLLEWTSREDIHWPPEIGTPQVRIGERTVELALPVRFAEREQVVVAKLQPTIRDDSLRLDVLTLSMGWLTVSEDPVESLTSLVDRLSQGEAMDDGSWRNFVAILTGEHPIEPVLELSDGRTVRVEAIRCAAGSVVVTCRTEGGEIDGATAPGTAPSSGPP